MTPEYIINKYLIGKDSAVQFKNDPATYYVKNVSSDKNSLFITLNGIQTYNKKTMDLIKVDGKNVIKENLKSVIKEIISQNNIQFKKSCSCGCNTCENTRVLAPILNESLAPREILSEGLKYHITHNKPLTEQTYRAGSQAYFNLWAEARALYSRGILEIQNQDGLFMPSIPVMNAKQLHLNDLIEGYYLVLFKSQNEIIATKEFKVTGNGDLAKN
jgi:hypothetical protein